MFFNHTTHTTSKPSLWEPWSPLWLDVSVKGNHGRDMLEMAAVLWPGSSMTRWPHRADPDQAAHLPVRNSLLGFLRSNWKELSWHPEIWRLICKWSGTMLTHISNVSESSSLSGARVSLTNRLTHTRKHSPVSSATWIFREEKTPRQCRTRKGVVSALNFWYAEILKLAKKSSLLFKEADREFLLQKFYQKKIPTPPKVLKPNKILLMNSKIWKITTTTVKLKINWLWIN